MLRLEPSPIESWFEKRKPESTPGQFIVWFPDGHAEAHEQFEIDGAFFQFDIQGYDDVVTKNGRFRYFTDLHNGHLITTQNVRYDSIDVAAYLAPFQALALYEPLGGDVIGVVRSFLR